METVAARLRLALFVKLRRIFLEQLCHFFDSHVRQFIRGIVEVILVADPSEIFPAQSVYVPIALVGGGCGIFDRFRDRRGYHIFYLSRKIALVQYLVALLIYRLSLLVKNIVVFKNILSYLEVAAFDTLLCAFDNI